MKLAAVRFSELVLRRILKRVSDGGIRDYVLWRFVHDAVCDLTFLQQEVNELTWKARPRDPRAVDLVKQIKRR